MARVETTPAVRFALRALLVYVVVMLLLIVVRFLRIFPLNSHPPKKTAVVLRMSDVDGRVLSFLHHRDTGDTEIAQRPL